MIIISSIAQRLLNNEARINFVCSNCDTVCVCKCALFRIVILSSAELVILS